MNSKRTILALATALLAATLHAADVQMKLDRNLISLLDRVVLSIEFIDTKGNAIELPPVPGLDIQYQGQSSETRIVNMQRSSKVIHRYLITPKQTGNFTIGPIQATYPGGTRTLQAQLQVIKSKDDPEAQQLNQLLYAEVSTPHTTPFVYEPFQITITLFVRDGIQTDNNLSIRGGLPEQGIDGELEWEIIDRDRTLINGTIFNTTTLRTTVQTVTAGTFIFEPQVQLNVIVPRQNRRTYGFTDPFFGDFFGRQERRPILLECNQLALNVQPVPTQNRPDSFTGGVGNFQFQATASPLQLKAGEPITLTSRITGIGNLDKITPPVLSTNAAYKLYQARRIPTDAPNTLQFEQVIIPQTATLTQLPRLQFSYFNTQDQSFRTLTAGPFSLDIQPGEQARIIATQPSPSTPNVELLERDIIHLKPMPTTWQKPIPFQQLYTLKTAYTLLAPLLLWALSAILITHYRKKQQDPIRRRRAQALPAAHRALKEAQRALHKKEPAACNQSIHQAITLYFGHRLNLSVGTINPARISQAFPKEKDTIQQLIEQIEHDQYSPETPSVASLKQRIKTTRHLLNRCERTRI